MSATSEKLRSFIERIERLEEDKSAVTTDIKEVYSEAKSMGFDTKAMRVIVKLRKESEHDRKEHEAVLATYMQALGMEVSDE